MISFTQLLRPNGKRKEVKIERPSDVEEKANYLIKQGYSFEVEELMNGTVSMTVEYPVGHDLRGEAAFNHKICQNGPEVPQKVDEMITEAYKELKNE